MQSNPVERRPAARPQQSLGFPPPQLAQPLTCPRCHSTATKFCYYNNYNVSQPRYFCKSCRRYWTHGGTLRNVPVGGGTRKSNKSRTGSVSVTATSQPTPASPAYSTAESERDMNGEEKEITPLLSPNLETSLKLNGYEFTYGFDEMGFGLSGGVGGFPELGDNSGSTLMGSSSEHAAWQLSSAEARLMIDADCLGSPSLAISNSTSENHAANNFLK